MNKEKEQICFFNTHKAWGGGEKWHCDAATFFHTHGYEVLVCGNENSILLQRIPKDVERKSVKYSNLSFLNPFAYWRTYRILRNRTISHIILCLPIDIKIAGIVAKLCGIPHIIYRRGSAIPITNSWSNRFLFSHVVTEIIANSEATKQTILQNNKDLFDVEKITVLYNGITIPNKIEHVRNEVFTIGTACRLEPQKNLFSLLEIAEKLKQWNLHFQIKIAGDGSLRDVLEKEIQKKQLIECVQLCGFQKDMQSFYESLDVFVLPSLWEGFGYVLAEAMMASIPLLAYNVSSNPELIHDGVNGFLIPLNDTDLFTEKLSLLIENEDLRKQMGQNARAFVETNFDKQETFAKVESYIQQL